MQFYVYDFSELEPAESDRFDVNGAGRFEEYALDPYWRDDGYWPLLIEVDGKAAGFALVNRESHRGAAGERNMGEYFVMRKFRKGGVGTEALRQVFARHPGVWEVAIAERNEGAKAFWPRAIRACGGRDVVCHRGDGIHWTGPIWAFRI